MDEDIKEFILRELIIKYIDDTEEKQFYFDHILNTEFHLQSSADHKLAIQDSYADWPIIPIVFIIRRFRMRYNNQDISY